MKGDPVRFKTAEKAGPKLVWEAPKKGSDYRHRHGETWLQAERADVQDGSPQGQDACGLVHDSRPLGARPNEGHVRSNPMSAEHRYGHDG